MDGPSCEAEGRQAKLICFMFISFMLFGFCCASFMDLDVLIKTGFRHVVGWTIFCFVSASYHRWLKT